MAFLAVAFLAVAFFAVAFLAVAFFAVAFLAVAFFAVAFFAGMTRLLKLRLRSDYIIHTSPQIEQLLGFTVEEWTRDPSMWLAWMHEDDCDREALRKLRDSNLISAVAAM